MRIVGLPAIYGLQDGLADAWRRIEIRLPHLEMDDIPPAGGHAIGLLHDVHDQKGFHRLCAS